MTEQQYNILGEFEEIDLEVEELSALAFVTWDNFENGGFKVEKEDYAPALRTLYHKALALEKHYKESLQRLMDSHHEGSGKA